MSLDLQSQYEKRSDDELLLLAVGRSSLTDEAASALNAEMRNRGLTDEDVSGYQQRMKREERREERKRIRKIIGRKRDTDSWVEEWVGVFWSVVLMALISIA